jgi:hypothetical protein
MTMSSTDPVRVMVGIVEQAAKHMTIPVTTLSQLRIRLNVARAPSGIGPCSNQLNRETMFGMARTVLEPSQRGFPYRYCDRIGVAVAMTGSVCLGLHEDTASDGLERCSVTIQPVSGLSARAGSGR